MSDNSDTEEIIQEFLELWQKQFSYLSKDPQTVANMLAMFASEQGKYFDSLKETNNVKSRTDTDLHDNVNDELCQLRSSVANLEKRVANLESAVASGRKKPASKAAREKPTGAINRATKTAK